MRAAEDFTRQKGWADIKGWIISGASKRGWTAWMIGAATCPKCSNVIGIAPLVPIVPNLGLTMHR
jgi:PhoPQ-activated pathogenicity-related protein